MTFWAGEAARQLGQLDAVARAGLAQKVGHVPETTWQTLLNVNHPEYPSGHGCHTGAVTAALRSYFGPDEFQYTVDSAVIGTTRSYDSFSAALDEVLEARIWAGLHFRHSMNDGAEIGRRSARWVVNRHFGT